jgi:hypothetical protein
MAGVKMMTLPQLLALPLAESIENAVGDIKQPGAKGKKQRLNQGQAKMHGAGEEPRPERGDRRRIQAKQMPPFRKVVEALSQDSVYFGHGRTGLELPEGAEEIRVPHPPDCLWYLVG